MTPADTGSVLVLAVLLRGESFNRRLAEISARIAERLGQRRSCVDGQTSSPLRRYAGEQEFPCSARVPETAVASDAFIVASPEYKPVHARATKNLIDWTSACDRSPSMVGTVVAVCVASLAGEVTTAFGLCESPSNTWARESFRTCSPCTAQKATSVANSSTPRCESASRRTFAFLLARRSREALHPWHEEGLGRVPR